MATQQVRATTNFDTNKDTRKTIPYNQTAIVPGTGNIKAYPYMISSLLAKSKSDWEKGCWPNQGFIEDDYSDVDLSQFNNIVKNFIAIPKSTLGSVSSPFYLISAGSNVLNYTYQYNNMTNEKNSNTSYRAYGTPWGVPGKNVFNQLVESNNNTYVVQIDNNPYTFNDSTTISSLVVVNNLFGAQTNTGVSIKVADVLDKNSEYIILTENNIKFYSGTTTTRSRTFLQPIQIFEFDGYYVAEVDGSGNYTNRLIEQDGKMYVTFNPYSLLCSYITGTSTYLYKSYYYQNLTEIDGFFKPDDIIYGYSSNNAYCIIKKEALIRFMNYVGIPWTFDATKAATGSIDNFDDGYNPNQQYIDPYNPPGQPDDVTGGGDGLGDNTSDSFVSSIANNPIYPTAKQYIMDGNDVDLMQSYMWYKDINTAFQELLGSMIDAVISLRYYPMDLFSHDPNEVGERETVFLGNIPLTDGIPLITDPAQGRIMKPSYTCRFNIGEYEFKEYYGTFMDYEPYTSISIFLPFIGWRDIGTSEVMGKKLKVYYIVDFNTGNCTAYLTIDDGTNSFLYSEYNGRIAIDIPLSESQMSEKLMTVGIDAISTGLSAVVQQNGVTSSTSTQGASLGTNSFNTSSSGTNMNHSTNLGTGYNPTVTTSSYGGGSRSGVSQISSMRESAQSTTTKSDPTLGLINGLAGVAKMGVQPAHTSVTGTIGPTDSLWLSRKPIIRIERPIKSEASSFEENQGRPANITKKLGDLTGYVECLNPVLNFHCDESERTKISALLQGGIYL